MEKTDIVFTLKVGDDLFSNESFLEYRPKPAEHFFAARLIWVCKNIPEESDGEEYSSIPVYGELFIPPDVPEGKIQSYINDAAQRLLTAEKPKKTRWQQEGQDRTKFLISKYFPVVEAPHVEDTVFTETQG